MTLYLRFAIALGGALFATFWIYSFGFTGNFKLDDFPNLSQLKYVTDLDTLLLFVFSGNAGPSGRPLALLSFVINQPAWDVDAAAFLYTSTLIHLINGLLLAWLAYRLLKPGHGESYAATAALVAATLWMLHPMFASTTLYVIQRMTSLSAMFVLAGLVGYVASRHISQRRPVAGIVGMALSIGLGTSLAVLCKENGAILPALAWLLDAVFLNKLQASPAVNRWRKLLTIGPTLLLLGYMAYKAPGLLSAYGGRDFTMGERLLTEARVLLDYLRLLVVPVRSQMGLFHDDYVISRGWFDPASTLPAVAAIIAMLAAAILLRKKYPLVFFAVAWFFIGHAMESSIFPLEIYFEHRNYLPAIGLALAAGAGFAGLELRLRRAIAILGVAYLSLYAFVLYETSQQWGNTLVAADLWYHENPKSDRATQYYAQTLLTYSRLDEIKRLYEKVIEEKPHNVAHRLQYLITRCLRNEPFTEDEWVTLHHSLTVSKLNYAIPASIEKISDIAIDNLCPAVISREQAIAVGESAVSNPRFVANGVVGHWIFMALAQLYDVSGNYEKTLDSLLQAKKHRGYPETSLMIASVLATHGKTDEAIAELDATLEGLSPYKPTQRHWWQQVQQFRQVLAQGREQLAK